MITKEYLQTQIATLIRLQQQHMANANAAQGAINMCKQLIEEMDKPEPEKDQNAAHDADVT